MTISLLGALEIRAIADELDLHPRKSLGQNFVIDSNVCQKIARLAQVESGDNVVEIGPGIGSLTLALLERGATVVAIEVDPRLANKLPKTLTNHGGEKFQVLTDDALAVTSLPISANKLVANLPYNISVPVLLHFLESFPEILSGIVSRDSRFGSQMASGADARLRDDCGRRGRCRRCVQHAARRDQLRDRGAGVRL